MTLVHRRRRFRAHPGNLARLAGSGVRVLTDCTVAELSGENRRLQRARLTLPDREETIAVDAAVVALGFLNDLGPLLTWGLDMSGRSVAVDQRMRTSIPRIYAAGDIADYPGKVRLISVGFGEIATAVGNAACDAGMTESLFPGHSTELPIAS